ncbi:MAG: 50S ribosomal protein L17 [Verrucomicrobiota bacterium]|nr:50S ribosomal protein L17 [Verrucomicrobiota bacterium]
MRHRVRTAKLGRTGEHRNAMLANMVCSLIEKNEIVTTLAKAKAARVVAEKMVTLGKRGTLHHRRLVAARLRASQRRFFFRTKGVSGKQLREQWRKDHDVVRILFDVIAPSFQDRNGGYTRIIKIAGARKGDAAQMAILKWVDEPLGEKNKEATSHATESAPSLDNAGEAEQAEPAEETPAAEEQAELAEETPAAEEQAEEPEVEATTEESGDTDESEEKK